jgi:hypothetical protein
VAPPSVYPYSVRKDNNLVIVALVLIVAVLVAPTVLAGLMYIMVAGVGSEGTSFQSPTATLSPVDVGTGVIGLYVLAVSSETPLAEVSMVVVSPQGRDVMVLGSSPVSAGIYIMGTGQGTQSYIDLDGSRTLSPYDRMEVRPTDDALYPGLYIVRLVHQPTDRTITAATVTIPWSEQFFTG